MKLLVVLPQIKLIIQLVKQQIELMVLKYIKQVKVPNLSIFNTTLYTYLSTASYSTRGTVF